MLKRAQALGPAMVVLGRSRGLDVGRKLMCRSFRLPSVSTRPTVGPERGPMEDSGTVAGGAPGACPSIAVQLLEMAGARRSARTGSLNGLRFHAPPCTASCRFAPNVVDEPTVLVPSGGNAAGGPPLTLKGAAPAQSARLRQSQVSTATAT